MKKIILMNLVLFNLVSCGLELEEDEISSRSNRNITRIPVANVSSNGSSCVIDLSVTMLGATSESTDCYESETMDSNACDGLKALIDFGLILFDSSSTATFAETPCSTNNSFGQCNDGIFLKRYYVGNESEQSDMCEEPRPVTDEQGFEVENEYEIVTEWISD